jgi:Flp pilus assembly CpaF family ATPase
MIATTYHTYADLLTDGGRLAATEWGAHPAGCASLAEAVAATLRHDPEAIVLRAVRGDEAVRGLAPAGLAA